MGYSAFPFKLELTHIFSMEPFADCRVKGSVWRVVVQISGMGLTAHCCRVGTMLLSSHISLPKQQQCAPPAHRVLTPPLIWSHWQASSQLTAGSECVDVLCVVVHVQRGWQVAGSMHCMAVNGRDLHGVCKPQPCLMYCGCQCCTSWDLYPKPPFYSHGKALQTLLPPPTELRWGKRKFQFLRKCQHTQISHPFLCQPLLTITLWWSLSLLLSLSTWALPFWPHSMEVLWELIWPTLQRVFFQWKGPKGPLQQQQKLSRVLWRGNKHTQGRWSLPWGKTPCSHSCHKKPHWSLKPHSSQVVSSVSNFLGFWPESTGSGLQMCWEFPLAIEVNGSWALNSLFQYKVRAKEEAQDLEEVFNLGLLPI